MKKVLLIELFSQKVIPLSLRTVASYSFKDSLIKEKISFELIEIPLDFLFEDKFYQKNSYTKLLDNLKNIETNFLEKIKLSKPDLICMSIWFWNHLELTILSKKIKNILPSVKIFLGGQGLMFPEEYLKNNNQFDIYCFERYGEEVFKDCLYYMLGKKKIEEIEGIFYRDNLNTLIKAKNSSKILETQNFYGAYDIFPINNNLVKDFSVMYEITRGCIFNCSYCAWGDNKIIHKDLDRVIYEINKLPDKKLFLVDSFCNTPDHMYVLSKIKKTLPFLSLFISYQVNKNISEDFFKILNEFKYVELLSGPQSFNETVLKSVKRTLNLDVMKFWSNECKKTSNICNLGNIIMGLPFQTLEIIEEDLYLSKKYFKVLNINLLVPSSFYVLENSQKKWGIEFEKTFPHGLLKTNALTEKDTMFLRKAYSGLIGTDYINPELKYNLFNKLLIEYKNKS